MSEISFVILHYQDIDTTEKCINSILSLDNINNINMIIVDNASPNNSGSLLQKKYESNKNIHILCSNKNLGFAKGNNLGYNYAKNVLYSNLIIVMNNDVIITQHDFISKIAKYVNNNEWSIIAPKIYTLDGKYQNPLRIKKVSNKKLYYTFIYNSLMKVAYSVKGIKELTLKFNQNRPRISSQKEKTNDVFLENIVPHGSCVIFLKKWINQEEIAFLPDTFMYGEEDILYEYSSKKNYKIVYTPSLWVTHLEDAATKAILTDNVKKEHFKAVHSANAAKVLIKMRLKKN